MSENRRTVLLTRNEEENQRLAPIFGEAGLATISFPGIVIADPEDWAPVDASIEAIDTFDGIFFTSRNAVRKFLARLRNKRADGDQVLGGKLIAAVGEKTEEALEAEGIRVDLVPEIGSAENLMASLDGMEVAGRRFLFPKSSIARDVLPTELRDRGAEVEEIVVYRTISPEAMALNAVRDALVAGTIDCVAFFSPSAARNVVQMLGRQCFEETTVAVIGPTTGAAAKTMGLPVHIMSPETNAEAFVRAIAGVLTT